MTDVISITSPDITSIHGLAKELVVLRELDMLPESHHIVLNMTSTRSARRRDIENALGDAVSVEIPRSNAVGRSTNRGVPVVADSPRDRAATRLRELGTSIAAEKTPTRRSSQRKEAR